MFVHNKLHRKSYVLFYYDFQKLLYQKQNKQLHYKIDRSVAARNEVFVKVILTGKFLWVD